MGIRPLSGRVFLLKALLQHFHQVDNLGGPLLGGFAFNDVCVVSLFALNKLQELFRLLISQFFTRDVRSGFMEADGAILYRRVELYG